MHFKTKVGLSQFAVISSQAKLGHNVKVGHYSVIEPDVQIGDNVVIGTHVKLKSGTVIEDNVFIDDYVVTSGRCWIGKGSQIRYQSIIARNVSIGENVFFCAGVKTAYLDHTRQGSERQLKIGNNCFIGDNATILAGMEIEEGVVIGAHSLVNKHCYIPYAVYIGTPIRHHRNLTDEERERMSHDRTL